MKVLIVGGGGREHALCWRLAQDPAVTRVLATPGNAGIAEVAECLTVSATDVDGVVNLVDHLEVDLTVVGPETPLVAGLVDALQAQGKLVFGPTAAAARLEGSKSFAKEVMARHGIPTARAGAFQDVEKAVAFVDELGGSAVVKADGLAAGKGVTVAREREAAVQAISDCLVGGAFGEAGATVVVEELLEGPEVSAFALCDGSNVVPLGLCQDFKRVGDADAGPNTGGMGAYSPLPFVDADTEATIWGEIVGPTLQGMAADGVPYKGVLFAGVMLTEAGPKVLEYNCRFGDPESQVLLPRMATDPAGLLGACAAGDLGGGVRAELRRDAAVTVVMSSGGYPGDHETGFPIEGLVQAGSLPGVAIFHAGTARDNEGRLVTAGGRVLAVTGVGKDMAEARSRAYEGVNLVSFDGAHFRRDIAALAAGEG